MRRLIKRAKRARTAGGFLLVLAVVALSAILLATSSFTFSELNRMKQVYLRDQAATFAALLETMPPEQIAHGVPASLFEEEEDLVAIRLFDRDDQNPENDLLLPLWNGRELFRTTELTQGAGKLFRAYIPFHSQGRMRIARIDLDAASADFLIVHARHNVLLASMCGIVLVMLSLTLVLGVRRTARLEHRQLELEQLARLGEMSASLAHEIRNPLGTIKGFAQLASEKASSEVAGFLKPVLDEVGRLEKLVNDLLLYGKPPAPSKDLTDWESLARELEAHARQAIGSRPIRFVWNRAAWFFAVDPDLLKEALLNLIRNAIEALQDSTDGEVRLTAVPSAKGGLTILVEDNGRGIPGSVSDKLFRPFFTTKASGTGLGLSITRKLAIALGGSLELQNLHPHGVQAVLMFPETKVTEWKKS
jgi:two-component system sensor histidine kinase HydH